MKKTNQYADLVNRGLYEKTPKAVFAALYVSELVNRLNKNMDQIDAAVLDEWKILHENGIIDQRPPKAQTQTHNDEED